ncbi:MAG: hypothetical protein NZ700_02635 [Gemmataceae bacterium]|nr:hypothetical protein [Gemmataceae bacterium]MDW8264133.1 hypothetical protein [Gemmataceae bacterium]
MTLEFPDWATLRLALTSGLVPAQVSLAPLCTGPLGEPIVVKPLTDISAATLERLQPLGVGLRPGPDVNLAERLWCWPQLLPLERIAEIPSLSERTAVLFEVADPRDLAALSEEMLRLGNDRQSFRLVQLDGSDRALLRVVGPPFYSVLRALDNSQQPNAVRAYREQRPRVWVELGWRHKLAALLQPPDGQMVLMRPPRHWTFLDDRPFDSLYDVTDFPLPNPQLEVAASAAMPRLTVPLRLVPGHADDPAELWVLPGSAREAVEELLRHADDTLVSRLAFAVGEAGGESYILLLARAAKSPPVLVLPGETYRRFPGLAHLFVPCRRTLQPPLERSVIQQLLAPQADIIVWLQPGAEGRFTPMRLPESAFRPLADWVEYVIDSEHRAVEAWVQAARFEFESFVCNEPASLWKERTRQPPRPPEMASAEPATPAAPPPSQPPAAVSPTPVLPSDSSARQATPDLTESVPVTPSQDVAQQLVRDLEQRFRELKGPEAEARRRELWPQLARLNSQLGDRDQAAVCWQHGLWDQASVPEAWARQWMECEWDRPHQAITLGDVDKVLSAPHPTAGQARSLAAWLLWTSTLPTKPDAVLSRLGQIAHFLEQREELLGVRAAWLAWSVVAQLSGGDTLALARARDRLLDRLLHHGLDLYRDVPLFLRVEQVAETDGLRAIGERALQWHAAACNWISPANTNDSNKPRSTTLAYVDLMFAFGMARLRALSVCDELLARARQCLLQQRDGVHGWLLQAFEERIEQVRAGRPHTVPLSTGLLQRLPPYAQFTRPQVRYVIDRVRGFSRILEPHNRVCAYRRFFPPVDSLEADIVAALEQPTVDTRMAAFERLLSGNSLQAGQATARWRVLRAALEEFSQLGESLLPTLAREVLRLLQILPRPSAPADLEEPAFVLHRALVMAGHFARTDLVPQLVEALLNLLEGQRTNGPSWPLAAVAHECLTELGRLGLGVEQRQLARMIEDIVLDGRDVAQLRQRFPTSWPAGLAALLPLAGDRLEQDQTAALLRVLDQAREALFDGSLDRYVFDKGKLACAYVTAVSRTPLDIALPRLDEFFPRIGRLVCPLSTEDFFPRFRLGVVEALVLGALREEFVHGPGLRRWLEEDEFRVRRRIQRDLAVVLDR